MPCQRLSLHLVDSLLHAGELGVAPREGDVGQQLTSHILVALGRENKFWPKSVTTKFFMDLNEPATFMMEL